MIREPILDLTVAEYELTAEEIASGEFLLPAVDSGYFYMDHMAEYDATGEFPENLELHVTIRYNSAEGEKALDYIAMDTAEQGWGIQYWADDEPESDWSWPGQFRFSTYQSDIPVSLLIDDPENVSTTAEKIVLSVSLSIGGRKILPEECRIVEETDDDPLADFYEPGAEAPRCYYARIYLKRPDWAPEHGTIHLTVVQQLAGDGSVWTTEQDMDY